MFIIRGRVKGTEEKRERGRVFSMGVLFGQIERKRYPSLGGLKKIQKAREKGHIWGG